MGQGCAPSAGPGLQEGQPARPLPAVVIHPVDDSSIGSIPSPPAAVVGQWGANATVVAIASNYVLTARHPTGSINGPTGVGTVVTIAGTPFVAAEIIPVVRVDSRSIGTGKPGPMTRDLEKRFKKLTQE